MRLVSGRENSSRVLWNVWDMHETFYHRAASYRSSRDTVGDQQSISVSKLCLLCLCSFLCGKAIQRAFPSSSQTMLPTFMSTDVINGQIFWLNSYLTMDRSLLHTNDDDPGGYDVWSEIYLDVPDLVRERTLRLEICVVFGYFSKQNDWPFTVQECTQLVC